MEERHLWTIARAAREHAVAEAMREYLKYHHLPDNLRKLTELVIDEAVEDRELILGITKK